MSCCFLPYNNMNQPKVYTYPLPPEPPSPHPTPLGHHRAPSCAPFAVSSFPLAVCFTCDGVYLSVLLAPFAPPSFTVSTDPFSCLSLSLPYR